MVKIGWKVVNGYGPYGYLQRSVKVGGKVKTEHIAYLGKAGEAGLIPGKGYTVGQAVEGHAGVRVIVPEVPLGTVGSLKPGPVKTWKGATNTGKGAVLRYAAGEMDSTGRREVKRLKKFQQFLVKEKLMTKSAAASHAAHLDASTGTEQTKRLVDGLKVTRKQDALTMKLKHPGKDTLILYRGWKVDQAKYLKLKKAKVGQMINLEDPPLYSWSLNPKVGHNFGHGSLVTKAEVPIDSLVLSDTVNSVGSHEGENEVLFKGVPKLAMEVVKTQ